MTARKMCGQFRTERIGIATGNQEPKSLPLQAIDKQFPTGKILNFVKKQVTRFAIDSIYSIDDFIVISDDGQPFIIKIDIAVRGCLLNKVSGIKRFTRPPRTSDQVDQVVS